MHDVPSVKPNPTVCVSERVRVRVRAWKVDVGCLRLGYLRARRNGGNVGSSCSAASSERCREPRTRPPRTCFHASAPQLQTPRPPGPLGQLLRHSWTRLPIYRASSRPVAPARAPPRPASRWLKEHGLTRTSTVGFSKWWKR